MQGFLFSKPLPETDLAKLFTDMRQLPDAERAA
jgi:EAL domain-containing protein (putative c-di-GMP-specific phosphodiesterase class I)